METALQGARCAKFLAEMYGNDPYVWDDQLSGLTRLECQQLRMRYCTRKGKLDLVSKGSNSRCLAGQKSGTVVQP